jgi:hypothetical protein
MLFTQKILDAQTARSHEHAREVSRALDTIHAYLCRLDSVQLEKIGGDPNGLLRMFARTEQLREL